MEELNDYLVNERRTQEQERRLKKAMEQREKVAQRKIDTRRNITVGELVSQYFPEVKCFQLQRTKVANRNEFARLSLFLLILAADTKYVAELKSKVTQRLTVELATSSTNPASVC